LLNYTSLLLHGNVSLLSALLIGGKACRMVCLKT